MTSQGVIVVGMTVGERVNPISMWGFCGNDTLVEGRNTSLGVMFMQERLDVGRVWVRN